jgi:hypothetical protein
MGVFGQWQPQYAEAGLVTFPVDITRKAPIVRNYLKAGRKASAQWASKFADASALGIVCGKRNRLTVLDIDEPCENLLADAQSRFGASPVIARTASGKFHAYYRHNGEKRKIRGVIEGRSVDLLGTGGMAIAPPSSGNNGCYEFIQGGLADFGNLPLMQGLVPAPVKIVPDGEVLAANGQRNDTLFKMCLREARSVADGDALRAFAVSINASGAWEPLPAEEVLKTAAGAWEKQLNGTNWVGSGPKIITEVSEFDRVFFPANGQPEPVAADAYYILTILRRVHFDKTTFFCANAFHKRLGWTLARFQRARRFLEAKGCLLIMRPPSAKDSAPALYRFGAR